MAQELTLDDLIERAPQEEVPQEDVQEDDGEQVIEEVVEEQQEEVQAEGEQQELEKPRAKRIPRERFDEVNKARAEAEERARMAEWKAQQQEEANRKLLALLSGEQPEAQEPEDEVFDTALEKKLSAKLEAMEQQQVAIALEHELQAADSRNPEFRDAVQHWANVTAQGLITRAMIEGEKLSASQAMQYAKTIIDKTLRDTYAKRPQAGLVEAFVMAEARRLGLPAKKASKAGENSVNMKALNELRETAGAPITERQSVQVAGSASNVDELVRRNKELGIDESYTRSFFDS